MTIQETMKSWLVWIFGLKFIIFKQFDNNKVNGKDDNAPVATEWRVVAALEPRESASVFREFWTVEQSSVDVWVERSPKLFFIIFYF